MINSQTFHNAEMNEAIHRNLKEKTLQRNTNKQRCQCKDFLWETLYLFKTTKSTQRQNTCVLLQEITFSKEASMFNAGADLDQVKIVNSQGKIFKYLSKSGNIFKNRDKIGKFRIFYKVN